MSRDNAKDAARPGQPEEHPFSFSPVLKPGVIPLEGRFTAEEWSIAWKNDPKTIRRWVKQYRIPHKKPGDQMVIDAVDFWAALPYAVAGDESEEKRNGGAGRKKGN